MLIAASNAPTAQLLTDFVWVFLFGTVIVAVLHAKKLPSLLGFLLTGLIVGPAGLGLVVSKEGIEIMAEIGIVLLMFTIGLEVSLKELAKIAGRVFGGGLMQITLTALATGGIAFAAGLPATTAVAIGLIASASSTALALRLLGDRGDLRSPHGQISLAILLMQDFAVVILMLLLPMLAQGELDPTELALTLVRALLISGGIVVAARFVFPWVLARVVELRSREVFLLTSVVAVFGTAWIADAAGLSLALGAFLAGLVISESEFSHQMSAEVLPFRDILNGLFFVSVGLLVDRYVLLDNLALIVGLIVGSLVLKAAIVFITAKAFRLKTGSALVAGIAISQVGEFALVLAQQAAGLELITQQHHSLIIAVAVATMMTTPLLLPFASAKLLRDAPSDDEHPEDGAHGLSDHVIIVGYGLNGANVARALTQLEVGFVIVEMNRVTVLEEQARGVPIVFGDATNAALLHHLHVEHARALVSCIADAAATRDIVASARHANPNLLIIARTRFVAEIAPLHELGADSVVPEEFETSMELIGRVMRAYGAPESTIHREKNLLRAQQYSALLDDQQPEVLGFAHLLDALDVNRVMVGPAAHGKSLAELSLRRESGATAVAVLRGDENHSPPDPNMSLAEGDEVVLVGGGESIRSAQKLLGSANAP